MFVYYFGSGYIGYWNAPQGYGTPQEVDIEKTYPSLFFSNCLKNKEVGGSLIDGHRYHFPFPCTPKSKKIFDSSYFGDFKDQKLTFIGSRSLMASPYNFLISSSLAFCLSLMSWCNGYIIYMDIMAGEKFRLLTFIHLLVSSFIKWKGRGWRKEGEWEV